MVATKKVSKDGDQECKGLRFRAFSNLFAHNGTFQENRGFRLLKKQSCTGCAVCQYTWDWVKECLADYDDLPVKGDKMVDKFQDYSVTISGSEGEDIEFCPIGTQVYK